MSEKRSRIPRRFRIFLRLSASLIAVALIVLLGDYVIRFCAGLFLSDDKYIVTLPGGESPVVSRLEQTGETGNSDYIYQASRATITVAGDLMMHMPIVESGAIDGGYNYDSIFTYISSYVSAADYAVADLETTLGGTDDGDYSGSPNFNSPDAIAVSAKAVGFDLLLTGNEHCYDTGTAGLKRTLEVLKAQKLDTLGTAATAEEAKYIVREIGGVSVGMVSYTYADIGDNSDQPTVNGMTADASAAGLICAFDYSKLDIFYSRMETDIAAMHEAGVEYIIAFLHWGDELSASVTDEQTAIAQKLCDLGVDLIVGGHPHVVQPMELLTSSTGSGHETVCLYSAGNLLSNQRADNVSLTTGQSEDGVLFSVTLLRYSDGTVMLEEVSILPVWILVRGSEDSRQYQVLPLDEAVADWETAYNLDEDQLAQAESSSNRTHATLDESLNAIQSHLTQAVADREAALAEIQGVG